MFSISVVVSCVGSSLCDELIARSEDSYQVYVCVCSRACVRAYLRVIVCGLGTSRMRRPRPSWTVHHRGEKKKTVTSSVIFNATHGQVPIERTW